VVDPYSQCLRHLRADERTAYLRALTPGSSLDHRGTTLDTQLLFVLLAPFAVEGTGELELGNCRFSGATFDGVALFDDVTFNGVARFDGVTFNGNTGFNKARFTGNTVFARAVFGGDAQFREAVFEKDAVFRYAAFHGAAWFRDAVFSGVAGFRAATFDNDAYFKKAAFNGISTDFANAMFNGDHARFGGATMKGATSFNTTTFNSLAWFSKVTFASSVRFTRTTFNRDASFSEATFDGVAQFSRANFGGTARFAESTFRSRASFSAADFRDKASFRRAIFRDSVSFNWTTFNRDANMLGVHFETASQLGPLLCGASLNLSNAVFGGPVTVEAVAQTVMCRRTRWSATASLRLRYATVDITDAVFEYPLHVAAHPAAFSDGSDALYEARMMGLDPKVTVGSVSGTDATHLMLSNLDLSECRFAGTFNLDQLRLDGECSFGWAPTRRSGASLRWWSRRQTLAEEHYWRAGRGLQGWVAAAPESRPGQVGAAGLARLYRQLRKSLEDAKDEPGAADFYYGEMEMRRHDRTRPVGERGLLAAYWALSGYGLRASRALGWLVAAMAVTVLSMMLWGLPKEDPETKSSGTLTGPRIELVTEKGDPVNPSGGLADRMSGERLEKSTQVVVNSVVFRSSGQDLTTAGTYIEMLSRVSEPLLLGLAVLAIRSRVKR
jgi:hypothetical protein